MRECAYIRIYMYFSPLFLSFVCILTNIYTGHGTPMWLQPIYAMGSERTDEALHILMSEPNYKTIADLQTMSMNFICCINIATPRVHGSFDFVFSFR